MRAARALLAAALLLQPFAGLRALPPAATAQPGALRDAPATLQVGLWTLWRDRAVTVFATVPGRATLRTCTGCAAETISRPVEIRAQGSGLKLNGLSSGNKTAATIELSGPLLLEAHGERLRLDHPVRIAARNGVLALTVTLPVESYVERVVASESSAGDSEASLQALAIVVRSFALHVRHGHTEYDLCDSTHCQLLHWAGNGRAAAAHAATLATSGETLWFHGHRAEAWFGQNCGGRTANPDEVWTARTGASMPWLKSQTDNYCTAGGAREWSAALSLAELTEALAHAGLARPGWTALTVVRRSTSGRAAVLRAGSAEFSAEDFRLAVGHAFGWGRILSDWFEIAPSSSGFRFHGRGSGHGVGLCQTGAAAMAAAGRNLEQILAQYFPGAEAADERSGRRWQRLAGEQFVLETLDPSGAAQLPALRRALAEAESRSGLHVRAPILLRAFPSTPAFREATLAPGWVAAFTESNWIGLQPLGTLAARGILESVLRHEFLHALVEQETAAHTPLWLREGLVELWAGESAPRAPAPTVKLEDLDRALAHAGTQQESAAAHRAAAYYASRLVGRFGREQALGWLRSGVPASALETERAR